MQSVIFTNNYAKRGGAIYSENSQTKYAINGNCVRFKDNGRNVSTGSIADLGGTIYASVMISFSDSSFISSKAVRARHVYSNLQTTLGISAILDNDWWDTVPVAIPSDVDLLSGSVLQPHLESNIDPTSPYDNELALYNPDVYPSAQSSSCVMFKSGIWTTQQELENYGVYVSGSWSSNITKDQNILSVLTSIRKISLALYKQSPKLNTTEFEVFKNILNKGNLIGFVFYPRSKRLTCQTHNLIVPSTSTAPPISLSQTIVTLLASYTNSRNQNTHVEAALHQALIECDINFGGNFSEYTSTHELGHGLEGATGGFSPTISNSFFNLIQSPFDPNSTNPQGTLYDSASIAQSPRIYDRFVYGAYLHPVNGKLDEWTRGIRGWGSSSGLKSSSIACDFQQDPHEEIGKISVSEVDEAAADMFLNWVYRKLDAPNSIAPSGFKNINWTNVNGCQLSGNADLGFPGISRSQLMNTIMSTLVP